MDQPIIHICMLGGFSITLGAVSINENDDHSRKPWGLLEYLIYHHDQMIASEKLIDTLWTDGHLTNPVNALKTLVLRSRKLLSPFGIRANQLLTQKRGAYGWCPDTAFTLDTDEFEQLCLRSEQPELSEDDRLQCLLQALELYKGDFLPRSSWETWVIPISDRFHSMYLKAVRTATEMLTQRCGWPQIAAISRRAVAIEPFNEEFHYALIHALYRSDKPREALDQYRTTANLFYDQFAITPSSRLMNLYTLIQNQCHGENTDLTSIQASLQEEASGGGAYFCEFSVFRDIYRLERRSIKRSGDSVFLCLMTITPGNDETLRPSILKRAMDHLGSAIAVSLRRGDAYTRYSVSQYLILLPSVSYEDSNTVMYRIVRNYRKSYPHKELNVHYSIQALMPEQEGTNSLI